jgi:hypothetical protein
LRAEIQTDDVRALVRQGEGDVAGAATEIEDAGAGLNLGEADDLAFPTAMQAEALEIIDQIVASGNGGKQIVHLGGPLFAGLVKCIAHPVSLTGRG